jgi:formylglycine-generating enzyme required for sulfatase activity
MSLNRSVCALACFGLACSEQPQLAHEAPEDPAAPAVVIGEAIDEVELLAADPAPPRREPPTAALPGQWISVEPGVFMMGSPPDDPCRHENENFREVTLTRRFYLMSTEVTVRDYRAMLGVEKDAFPSCGDRCPAALLNWHEAVQYCNALSEREGLPACYHCGGEGSAIRCVERDADVYRCSGYRLPTEAEWEYAYRAGTTTQIYSGSLSTCSELDPNLDRVGWFLRNSGLTSHPVARKGANAWGFFDMAGNVWEWTHDRGNGLLEDAPAIDPYGLSEGTSRVMRGGSYNCLPSENRAAHRSGLPDLISGNNVGFRCARTAE